MYTIIHFVPCQKTLPSDVADDHSTTNEYRLVTAPFARIFWLLLCLHLYFWASRCDFHELIPIVVCVCVLCCVFALAGKMESLGRTLAHARMEIGSNRLQQHVQRSTRFYRKFHLVSKLDVITCAWTDANANAMWRRSLLRCGQRQKSELKLAESFTRRKFNPLQLPFSGAKEKMFRSTKKGKKKNAYVDLLWTT